jgi:hypothetical protein
VVTFHHPVYATAASRQKEEEGKAVRVHWRPVFDKYGVDLVLQGHDHSYGRSGLMREDNVLDGATVHTRRGTVYAVSVSGPKMYELGEQPWMRRSAERTQLYQLVSIDGDRLHYAAKTAAGTLFDEFELRKQPAGGNVLVERGQLEAERAKPPAEKAPAGGGNGLAAAGVVGLAGLVWVVRLLRRAV